MNETSPKKWKNEHADSPLNRKGRRMVAALDPKKPINRIKKAKNDKEFERKQNIQIKQEAIINKTKVYREEKAAKPEVRAKMKAKRLKAVTKIQAKEAKRREKRLKNLNR